MLAILLAVLLGQAVADQPAPVTDVRQLKPSPPTVLAEIDTATIQGDPVGLACAADGTIYLRVGAGKDKARHYLVATRPAVSIGQSDGVPKWAADQWAVKSGLVAPGDPSLRIDVQHRIEHSRTVNTPSGGDIAGTSSPVVPSAGGGDAGVSTGVAMAAANNSIVNGVVTLRFKGQVVGEWTNEVPALGMRFGWAPAPMGLLAYVDAEGRLFLLDREGRRAIVAGVERAILPAWSPGGRRLVYLQKKSRGLYLLAEVTLE
jgi:hypothetical protein